MVHTYTGLSTWRQGKPKQGLTHPTEKSEVHNFIICFYYYIFFTVKARLKVSHTRRIRVMIKYFINSTEIYEVAIFQRNPLNVMRGYCVMERNDYGIGSLRSKQVYTYIRICGNFFLLFVLNP